MSKENKEHKSRRLRISLIDDTTHRQIWVLRGKRTRLIFTAASAIILFILAIYAFIALTPVKTFFPGYPDAHQLRAASTNAMTIDSLETVVARWEFYAENLRRVLDGSEEAVPIDSLLRRKSRAEAIESAQDLSKSDSLLRNVAEEAERFGLHSEKRKLPIEGMHLFPPVKGVVSQSFDITSHPFTEVTAPDNAIIMSIADGTVISASWSDTDKYTIIVQHENDLVSIIRGAGKTSAGAGRQVKAGTPVGGIQSSAGSAKAQVLKVELWYKGEAVDPAEFIKF